MWMVGVFEFQKMNTVSAFHWELYNCLYTRVFKCCSTKIAFGKFDLSPPRFVSFRKIRLIRTWFQWV